MKWDKIKVGDYIYLKIHNTETMINPLKECEGRVELIERDIGRIRLKISSDYFYICSEIFDVVTLKIRKWIEIKDGE